MYLQMGKMNNLEVIRITEFSYILGDEETEVFLHMRQATRKLEVGDAIDVFLYFDNQKRITATMKTPLVDLEKPAFLEVVAVNQHLGVFLNMGLIKDLLLSRDDLPFIKKEWPKVGDTIYCKMKTSKNQLTAKIIPRYEIAKHLQPSTELEEGTKYEAYNVYKTEEGNVFFTKEGHEIYVYFKHVRKTYRLGEKADVKIHNVKGEFKYGGTLIEQKEIMMSEDAKYLVMYMKSNKGEMPYSDKSSAEEITERFHMSKNAFKRALGSLYKNKQVILESDKTTLVKDIEK